MQYLAEQKPELELLPRELKARMTAVKWQFWETAHWDPACAIFMFERVVKKIFRRGDADPAEIRRGEGMMARLGPVLDGELQKHRYVEGDKLTVADISLGASLVSADQAQFPIEPYRAIQRWRAELSALPGWKKPLTHQAAPAAA